MNVRRLIAARETLGWTQKFAGAQVGVSRNCVAAIERGQNRALHVCARLQACYIAAGVDPATCVHPTALRVRQMVCLFCDSTYGEPGGCTICVGIREMVA